MGYVDMLFMHEDRFYLLDWKSNHLGHRIEDYSLDRLTEVMVREHYILQYSLYTVAANRYLEQRHPGYSYAKHFGGVFYVFLRGVDATAGSTYGIYNDRPAPDLIHALDDALIE
jgi:exodeoxyribonuclease V beta subunit